MPQSSPATYMFRVQYVGLSHLRSPEYTTHGTTLLELALARGEEEGAGLPLLFSPLESGLWQDRTDNVGVSRGGQLAGETLILVPSTGRGEVSLDSIRTSSGWRWTTNSVES